MASLASLVLRAVASLPEPVGRRTIAYLLLGRRSEGVGDLTGHPLFGAAPGVSRTRVQDPITYLLVEGLLIEWRDGSARVALTPLGRARVAGTIGDAPAVPAANPSETLGSASGGSGLGSARAAALARAAPGRPLTGTLLDTYALYLEGLAPSEIAEQRGLTETTIWIHLADLIAAGRIDVDELVLPEVRRQIEAAADRTGATFLRPIKEALPETVTFHEIRCVLAARRRHAAGRDGRQPGPGWVSSE